ncbi:HAD family phosphatase [Ruficoccus amylovorans]|uniref:HAD family phosphatase n=1 Tax=Ruficoccus amylovorans TaxID=1804625 RepID=A0A842HEF2_9BACT|nr:HAD family phosphatase [Ruficoccus amylovorans]MBC2594600.1 HAD family phosphatase [Ruficoccus amylovorans]
MASLQGALFDWDGVIVDSSAAHELSWDLLAAEEKLTLPPGHFKRGFGRKNTVIIPEILGWTTDPAEIARLGDRKEALYREIIRERGIEPLPGVYDLLRGLKEAGIPCCVGTSSSRENIETIMDIAHLREYFADITSAEDVTVGKPDPEVFLVAAKKIDRSPEDCVVFEDAIHGLEAGRAGGMKVVGVATTHRLEDLGLADLAVHRLTEVDVPRLRELF